MLSGRLKKIDWNLMEDISPWSKLVPLTDPLM